MGSNSKSGSIQLKLPEKIFFISTLLYFTLFGWYVIYYQEKASLFMLTREFFLENISVPGGFLEYAASFLTSLGNIKVLGALAFSSIIWLAMMLCRIYLSNVSGRSNILLPLITGAIMFWLQADYQYTLSQNLGLMLQLLLLTLVTRKPSGWWPLLIFPLWFWFTGGFSWIFFITYALPLVASEGFKGLVKTGIMAGWTLLLIWFISEEYLFLTTFDIFTHPADMSMSGINQILFTAAALLIVALPLAKFIKIRIPSAGRSVQAISIVTALILSSGISVIRFERATAGYFRSENLFFEKKYDELIEFNLRHPSRNYVTNYLVNIALCETGTLNDRLFSFNQASDGRTLFMKWEIVGEILRKGGLFYYTIGMVNEAHRWAFEYMVMHGPTPEGLKLLIKTEIINGNYITAGRYINMLKKTLFYRDEGKYYERLLFNESGIEKDAELGEKRSIRLRTDFFSVTDDPVINIRRIVEVDTLNRKAFDYLMAYLLVTKDYKAIVEEWSSIGRYSYKRVPVHIQEAGVAISTLYNVSLPLLNNVLTDNAVVNDFNRYLKLFNDKGADLKRAEPVLREQFGTTFWYWVFYR